MQTHNGVIPQNYRGSILLFLLTLIILEIIWNVRNNKKTYDLKETAANMVILFGFQFSKIVFAGYQLAILGWASKLAFRPLPENAWVFIVTFILADFIYYWFHRTSHLWAPLWAFHHIHHSSPHMNLTSAYRLNWFSAIISPIFFVPLALLGCPPEFIALSYALNLLYQFFLHTEFIGKIKPVEGIIDTPSAHRVHHGSNDLYIDKNFGGVFMWWDRLFRTYQPETEKVVYGIPGEIPSHNPFRLVFQGFINLFKRIAPQDKKAASQNHFSASTFTTQQYTEQQVI